MDSITKPFLGVSNRAFGNMIAEGLRDACKVTNAGLALPEAKPVRSKPQGQTSQGMMIVSNQAFGAYLKQTAKIRQIAQTLTPNQA